MKIAVMTDVHGNLPALEAALARIKREDCSQIWHTGDAIAIGPFPRECLDLMRDSGVRMLKGNHEIYQINRNYENWPGMSPYEHSHQAWVQEQLGAERCEFLAGLPMTAGVQFGRTRIHLCHYALDADGSFKQEVRQPTVADVDELFREIDAEIIFYGHNHAPSDICGRARYVTPGALGCSASEAVARFAVIEERMGDIRVKTIAEPYSDLFLRAAFSEREVPQRDFLKRIFFSWMQEDQITASSHMPSA